MGMTQRPDGKRSTRRHLALLGGFRERGAWQVPYDLLVVAAVGGADIDLTEAELPPVLTITKVSLVGGVVLRVPPDAVVEVEALSLLGGGGRVPAPRPAERPAPIVQ